MFIQMRVHVPLKSVFFAKSVKMLESDHFLPGTESLNLGTSLVKSEHAVYGDYQIDNLESSSCIARCGVAAW